jgi:hypothetical protein
MGRRLPVPDEPSCRFVPCREDKMEIPDEMFANFMTFAKGVLKCI